jgi:hypothetical protein
MPNDGNAQPDREIRDRGFEELLNAHRAISDAWYSNWRAEQEQRLNQVIQSRARGAAA